MDCAVTLILDIILLFILQEASHNLYKYDLGDFPLKNY